MAEGEIAFLERRLKPGERVLWTGRPPQGIALRRLDLLLIPLSVAWFAGTMSLAWQVFESGATIESKIMSAAFAAAGAYIVFGRFVTDAVLRKQTRYAITNHRVLVIGGFAGKNIAFFERPDPAQISVRDATGDRATVQFGEVWPLPRWHATYWREPEFFRIHNPNAAVEFLKNSAS